MHDGCKSLTLEALPPNAPLSKHVTYFAKGTKEILLKGTSAMHWDLC